MRQILFPLLVKFFLARKKHLPSIRGVIYFAIGKKFHDVFPSKWRVTKFVVEHNNVLLTQSEVRFLPAYRTISEDDTERILLLKEGGLSVRQVMRVIELEKNVKHGYLPFIERDIRNLFVKTKKFFERNDAMDLLIHGKTILFGCALLRNETISAFRWLMKTFISLMKKSPKIILTDQDLWMKEAISRFAINKT
ncbi:protein FAR1-RELATED SEQUENCE [Trifolium repens]|nr:protein FAR1-RELATED SEQUENCE [Trifolium repens]